MIWLVWVLLFLGGCQVLEKKIPDGKPLEYAVSDENRVPGELKRRIAELAENPFQITYVEGDRLYIGQGYGRQETKGYAIRIDSCVEGADVIGVKTTLLGPGSDEIRQDGELPENVCMREGELSACPYVVLEMGKSEKPVVFE